MVPVAVVTGGVAVGKTTILREADELLVRADVPHASLELEDVGRFWGPNPAAGGTRPDVAYRNLASVWANYRAAGADRLLLSLLMERRSDLQTVRDAVPDAGITVVRLSVPLAVLEERVRSRDPAWAEHELSAVRWWASRLQGSTFADHVVDNSHRPAREVAAEVLRVLGWLG